jgi:hypothetical protein
MKYQKINIAENHDSITKIIFFDSITSKSHINPATQIYGIVDRDINGQIKYSGTLISQKKIAQKRGSQDYRPDLNCQYLFKRS